MITIYHSTGDVELDRSFICKEIAQQFRLKNNDYISNDGLWNSILYNNRLYLLAIHTADKAIEKAIRN